MIIKKNEDNTYTLTPTLDESIAIDWMTEVYGTRKFERFMEDYLKSRLKNKQHYDDREVLKLMTRDDKVNIRSRNAR